HRCRHAGGHALRPDRSGVDGIGFSARTQSDAASGMSALPAEALSAAPSRLHGMARRSSGDCRGARSARGAQTRPGLRRMLIVRDKVRIDAPYREALERAGLGSTDAVLNCFGDRLVAWSRGSDSVFVSLPESSSAVYVKRYHYQPLRRRVRLALRGTLLGR